MVDRQHASNYRPSPAPTASETQREERSFARDSARLAEQAQRWISEAFVPATVLINRQYETLFFHGNVTPYMALPPGRPTLNLLDMLRDGLSTPVRHAVRQALRSRQPVESDRAQVKRPEGFVPVSIRVVPVEATPGAEGLCLVAFSDLGGAFRAASETVASAVQSHDDLVRRLQDDLQATKDDLQSTIAELETSNEALRTSNEEMMSINEALQSANEELETSREELQSLNEELQSLNRQLQDHVAELEQANNDTNNLFVSTEVATLFLDTKFCIRRYTPAAAELFSLIPADVGRPIQDIKWKFTDPEWLAEAQEVLETHAPLEKQVQAGTSRWFIRRILPYRTSDQHIDGVVVTLTDITSLRHSETQARERLAQLEAIYEGAPIGLAVMNTDLRYIRINDRLAAFNGLAPAAHLGQRIRDVLPADLASIVEHQCQGVLDTGEPTIDLEFRGATARQPGVLLDWLVSYYPLKHADEGMFGVSIVVQDVTPRKQAERRLATERAVAQTLVDANDFEMAVPNILDAFTQTFGVHFCEFWVPSAGGAKLSRVAFRSLQTPDQAPPLKALFDTLAVRSGDGWIGQVWRDQIPRWITDIQQAPDFRWIDKAMWRGIASGFAFPVLIDATCIGVMSFFTRERLLADPHILSMLSAIGHQIGEFVRRSRAEQELRESEERFRSVMLEASIPMMAHTLDELLTVNTAFTRLTGYTVGEIPTAQDWLRKGLRVPADQVDTAARQLRRRLAAGPPFREKEVFIWTKTGVRRSWLFQVSEARRLPDGSRFFVSMATDITEREQAEAVVREADQRKTDFLAILGHELRNPIAAIAHGIETIELELNDAATNRWTIGMLRQQIDQVVALLDDLLVATRITQGRIELRKEKVTLSTAIERAVSTIQPLIDERHHTLIVTPTADVVLEADPLRLQQIVINLLSNAAQYTEAGGHIQLLTNLEDDDVVIRVVDNGVGLSAHMQARLFEPFSQPASSLPHYPSLGMGLALVRQLTELHGGQVTAYSAGPGQGSEFVVRLPARSEIAAETLPKPPASALTEAPPGLQVLIVDDNVSSTRALARILQRRGRCEVTVAHDGASALAMARARAPQIVLLDIGLPDMSGYEVARQFREEPQLAQVFLIAVTGYGHEEARQASREAGIDEHIAKPINTTKLLRLLADWGGAGESVG